MLSPLQHVNIYLILRIYWFKNTYYLLLLRCLRYGCIQVWSWMSTYSSGTKRIYSMKKCLGSYVKKTTKKKRSKKRKIETWVVCVYFLVTEWWHALPQFFIWGLCKCPSTHVQKMLSDIKRHNVFGEGVVMTIEKAVGSLVSCSF